MRPRWLDVVIGTWIAFTSYEILADPTPGLPAKLRLALGGAWLGIVACEQIIKARKRRSKNDG